MLTVGFTNPAFYRLADFFNLKYIIGQVSNEILKKSFLCHNGSYLRVFYIDIKYQNFINFECQTK